MSGMWQRPFSVVSDGGDRYFVVAQVEERTARRAKKMMDEGKSDDLAQAVQDALNLRAMPGLIAGSGL